jgi:hypothetical protein
MSSKKNPDTERFGGPGSSHQDRTQPEAVDQVTGHKGGTPADIRLSQANPSILIIAGYLVEGAKRTAAIGIP